MKTGDSVKPLIPLMEPKSLLKSITPTYSTLGKKVTIAIKADHFEAPFVASSNMKGVTLSPVTSSLKDGLSLDVQIDASASPGFVKSTVKVRKGRFLKLILRLIGF